VSCELSVVSSQFSVVCCLSVVNGEW